MKSTKESEANFGFSPVAAEAKQGLVNEVFARVAPRYDLMNDLMSGGLHRLWKDDLISWLAPPKGASPFALLDVAGGTGDIAFRFLERGGGGAVVVDLNRAASALALLTGAITTVKGFATKELDGFYGSDIAFQEFKSTDMIGRVRHGFSRNSFVSLLVTDRDHDRDRNDEHEDASVIERKHSPEKILHDRTCHQSHDRADVGERGGHVAESTQRQPDLQRILGREVWRERPEADAEAHECRGEQGRDAEPPRHRDEVHERDEDRGPRGGEHPVEDPEPARAERATDRPVLAGRSAARRPPRRADCRRMSRWRRHAGRRWPSMLSPRCWRRMPST